MEQVFTNNAKASLTADITSSAATLSILSGQGALFPVLSGQDFFLCTLSNSGGTESEIIKVVGRDTDTFTILRQAEEIPGFSGPYAFSAGDSIELRLTAGSLQAIHRALQIDGIISGFNKAYTAAYTELVYTSGELTGIDIWVSNSKALKLYSKVLSYTSGNLDTTVLTDEVNTRVLTAGFTYTNGLLSAITRELS